MNKSIKNIFYKKIINEEINNFIKENKQLADKIYFDTGKLSLRHKEMVLDVTRGDNYTKLIADFCYHLFKNDIIVDSSDLHENLEFLYNEIKNYNKNVFPIIGYDVYKPENVGDIIRSLEVRNEIIETIRKLPSFAIRNLKNDIRIERNYNKLKNYLNDLSHFMWFYNALGNRPKEIQKKILQKMFTGGNTTMEDLMNFADDKENFIGGVEITKEDVKEMSKYEDFEIIYEQDNSMIVRVDSAEGIKNIGCNSLWCFTYGEDFLEAARNWSQYSHNDMVYVLIDFNDNVYSPEFMHVLTKPLIDENGRFIEYDGDGDDYPLYDMLNDNFQNPYTVLRYLFGKNYEEIIYKYLNFEY